jgi:hypothetical protein
LEDVFEDAPEDLEMVNLQDGAAAPTATYSSLRLPAFWTDRPQAWFNNLEAKCDIRTPPITLASSKYLLASQALPLSVRTKVANILDSVSPTYPALKTALLALYVPTKSDDAVTFLKITDIGDELPSGHYQPMHNLWHGDGEGVFRASYLRSLPQSLQDSLAGNDEDTEALSKKADIIVKNRRANAAHGISALSSVEPCAAEQAEINAICSKYANKDGPTVSAPARGRDNTGICFAHRKYGKDAHSCRGAPCPFAGMTAPKPAGNSTAGR